MNLLAIDPGPKQSAYAMRIGEDLTAEILPNEEMIEFIYQSKSHVVIEMIASYGMPCGQEIFETVIWIGRFLEANGEKRTRLVYRKEIKIYFCNSMRAKDSNIRQALIDRFGHPGTKKNPGLLYGFKADMWSALAILVYCEDKQKEQI